MKSRLLLSSALLVAAAMSSSMWASENTPAPALPTASSVVSAEQAIDRAIDREHALVESMKNYRPVVETYFQNVRPDQDLGTQPDGDRYFLGRMDMSDGVTEKFYTANFDGTTWKQLLKLPFKTVSSATSLQIAPMGFSHMIFIDRNGFDRAHYDFKFVRREFLGEVRTMMFEVTPKATKDHGRFLGRIWVEDQDYNIVRFNGVYTNPASRSYYFHMDSWRANVRPNVWVPSHVYSEEQDLQYRAFGKSHFKAQVRLWGYDLHAAGNQQEFSTMTVDSPAVKDEAAAAADNGPVESFRQWQREAENNILDKLERAGLLAPEGELDKVLATVVSNLEITNNLDIQPEVRCRVLLTSPLESFTVGHTIVISRGLLDVLPDEASLASVMAHELAHIVAGDGDQTRFAFADKTLFDDDHSFHEFGFARTAQQEGDADHKAIDLLKNSPYKDKLSTAGLFLRQLQARAAGMPELTRARIGNGLVTGTSVTRMAELMSTAPELRARDTQQIAALPLGGRVKIDAWDDHVEMSKARQVALISPKEKFPLEITPYTPRLTRMRSADSKAETKPATETKPTEPKLASNTGSTD
jgi:peptidase M48-like protein